MHTSRGLLSLGAALAVSALMSRPGAGADMVFRSSAGGTSLLELFSSEGCSSCPPADALVSSLRTSSGLWRDFVPAVFHVDYWDYLGWRDVLASPVFTRRQQDYGRLATPEFVLNGRVWYPGGSAEVPKPAADAGELEVRPEGLLCYHIAFHAKGGGRWRAHAALLGFDIVDAIPAGENAGRTLRHDFVALGYQSEPLVGGAATITVKSNLAAKPERFAVAVWVTREGDPTPVQAAGGLMGQPHLKGKMSLSPRRESDGSP
jgi:hypothetical protein